MLIVAKRWGRVRWTRVALLDEGAFLRTEKSCSPDTSTLVSSWRKQFPPVTVAKKARAPGSARIIRKPLRGECRVIPV